MRPDFVAILEDRGTLKSSVGFDYAKGSEDCHCEGEARNNPINQNRDCFVVPLLAMT